VFEDAYNYMKFGQILLQHFGDIYEQNLNDLGSAGNVGEHSTACGYGFHGWLTTVVSRICLTPILA
jgi:hypothetical protein